MVQKKFFVPNLFTGLNFLLGIYSILLMAEAFAPMGSGNSVLGSSKPPIILAAWFTILCVLFDKLDGFAAKLLNASSGFGAQFDSLADLVAFGVAPGFLVYFYMQWVDAKWFLAHRPLMIASVSVYMLCAALRLARFNSVDLGELKGFFHGLASTFAGGFVSLSVILHWKYDLFHRWPESFALIPLLLIFVGLLMVSPFYLPKLIKRKNRFRNAFQMLNIFIGYLCGFGLVFPEILFGQCLLYLVIGFTYGLLQKDSIEASLEAARSETNAN